MSIPPGWKLFMFTTWCLKHNLGSLGFFYCILNIFNVYSLAVDLLWLHIWGSSNVAKLAEVQVLQCFSPLNGDEGTLQGKSNCANYATMPPSTPWSTTKVQTQGNHEVMTYSTLQRREQRPHTVSLGKGGRRIAAKSQSFANATGYCVHRDGEFTTRSKYAFMNFTFTRVWKPRQKPKRFQSPWGSDQCSATATGSPHLSIFADQGSCRTIQLIEMMGEPRVEKLQLIWWPCFVFCLRCRRTLTHDGTGVYLHHGIISNSSTNFSKLFFCKQREGEGKIWFIKCCVSFVVCQASSASFYAAVQCKQRQPVSNHLCLSVFFLCKKSSKNPEPASNMPTGSKIRGAWPSKSWTASNYEIRLFGKEKPRRRG